MIGKVLRGRRVAGLLRYLYSEAPAQQAGQGGRSPHVNPRIVGAWDDPAGASTDVSGGLPGGFGRGLEPVRNAAGVRDFRALTAALEAPLARAQVGPDARPVYHLIVRNHADDRVLTDGEWGEIAADLMAKTGLAPAGDDAGARWVAVRHADDHVHLVATLARQDGRRVWPRNDFYRIREACQAAEERYGLTVKTAPGDRTAHTRATRAETEKATRRGWREPARVTLRRRVQTAAAGAESLPEFVDRLRADGLLVRLRDSTKTPGQVTGYAVALPDATDSTGAPIFYGGGRLAPDLTLPKLTKRWQPPAPPAGKTGDTIGAGARSGERAQRGSAASAAGRQQQSAAHDRLTLEDRRRIYEQAAAAAKAAAEHLSRVSQAGPAGAASPTAADVAWAGADFLAAAARVLEGAAGGPLTAAADEFTRAARSAWGRIPAPSHTGGGLRRASALLLAAGSVGPGEARLAITLLAQLQALADALTRLREAQHRAAQAAAARAAATAYQGEYLHRATRTSARTAAVATGSRHPQQPGIASLDPPGQMAPPSHPWRRGPHR